MKNKILSEDDVGQGNSSKRNVMALIVGRLASMFGSSLLKITIPLFLIDSQSSASEIGVFLAIISIPSILLAPFIGNFIEQINRKFNMVLSDLLHGVLFTIMLVMLVNGQLSIEIFAVLMMISLLIEQNFDITTSVMFSEIISNDYLEKANSIKSSADSAAMLIAPALGAILYSKYGLEIIIIIDIASFFISAVLECFIVYQFDKPLKSSLPNEMKKAFKNIAEGAGYVKSDKNVLKLFVIIMLLNLLVAPTAELVFPILFVKNMRLSSELFGYTSSAFIVGTLLASSVIVLKKSNKLLSKLKMLFIINAMLMILVGAFAEGIRLFSTNNMAFFYVFIVLQIMMGVCTSFVNIPLISFFQKNVPVSYQGRFFSFLALGSALLIPLGNFIVGNLIEITNASHVLIACNLLIIIIVSTLLRTEVRYNYELV